MIRCCAHWGRAQARGEWGRRSKPAPVGRNREREIRMSDEMSSNVKGARPVDVRVSHDDTASRSTCMGPTITLAGAPPEGTEGLRTSDHIEKPCRTPQVYYRGRRIPDVTDEPELRVAIDHAAIDFDLAHDPANHELMVAKDADTGHDVSAYYRIPRSTEDLLARSKLIETVTAVGGTMVTLIKEIGSDALFALQRVLEGEELERLVVSTELRRQRSRRLRGTDRREGDRSKGPSEQDDPDMYMRVCRRQRRHRCARRQVPHIGEGERDEIIVLPTRAMSAIDADYAVVSRSR